MREYTKPTIVDDEIEIEDIITNSGLSEFGDVEEA